MIPFSLVPWFREPIVTTWRIPNASGLVEKVDGGAMVNVKIHKDCKR
jgi:hypothetical protein